MKSLITEPEIISLANTLLREHPSYEEGMRFYSGRMEKGILVLDSECFFEKADIPTAKTVRTLPIYAHIVNQLSEDYVIA